MDEYPEPEGEPTAAMSPSDEQISALHAWLNPGPGERLRAPFVSQQATKENGNAVPNGRGIGRDDIVGHGDNNNNIIILRTTPQRTPKYHT